MTDTYWNDGAANGTWTDAANWTNGAPAAGVHVFVDNSTRDITGGDFSATALGKVSFGPNYTGTPGTSGTRLKLNCDAFSAYTNMAAGWIGLMNAGAGSIPVDILGGDPATAITDLTTQGLHIRAEGTDDLYLTFNGGYVVIDAATSTGHLADVKVNGPSTWSASIENLQINDLDTVATTEVSIVDGHTVVGVIASVAPVIYVIGGRLDYESANVTEWNAIEGQGLYNGAGTITQLRLISGDGAFDCRSNDGNGTITITDVEVRNGIGYANTGAKRITYTNPIEIRGSGRLVQDASYTSASVPILAI